MPTIDEHLHDQARLGASLLATIEPVDGDPEVVSITPYVGRRCACGSEIRLRKQDLEAELTPDVVTCCGKLLRVFRVHLAPGAQLPATDLVRQLARATAPGPSAELTARFGSCDCEELWAYIEMLQELLATAPTSQKASLVRAIRAAQAQARSCGC